MAFLFPAINCNRRKILILYGKLYGQGCRAGKHFYLGIGTCFFFNCLNSAKPSAKQPQNTKLGTTQRILWYVSS